MPMCQKAVVRAIAEALPEETEIAEDLVALGTVVSGVILEAPADRRGELVDAFCKTLRKSLARELN